MISYGQDEKSDTFKKSFPATFMRLFFRYVKAIANTRGCKLSIRQVNKRFRKLPTAFLIPAGRNRCTMHDISCPQGADCPFVTLNQKVILTHSFNKKRLPVPSSHRTRLFFRDDQKKALSNIFMTTDDTQNCTFEPQTASLKA